MEKWRIVFKVFRFIIFVGLVCSCIWGQINSTEFLTVVSIFGALLLSFALFTVGGVLLYTEKAFDICYTVGRAILFFLLSSAVVGFFYLLSLIVPCLFAAFVIAGNIAMLLVLKAFCFLPELERTNSPYQYPT